MFKVVDGIGFCDPCGKYKDLIILDSSSGTIGICLDCYLDVTEEMQLTADKLAKEILRQL